MKTTWSKKNEDFESIAEFEQNTDLNNRKIAV